MNIQNNTVLITGGGSGIGFELAKILLQNNNEVIICGRNDDKLKKASQQLNNCRYVKCDITNKDDAAMLVSTVSESFPSLNILVNNAGAAYNQGPSKDNSFYEKAALEINTNYLAMIRLNELLIPHLLKQSSAAIVNISSATALVPLPYLPTYSASKAAVHSYTKSLRFLLKNTSD